MTNVLIKIAAVLALLVLLYMGEQAIEQRGADRQWAKDAVAITQLKADAAALLASETEKTRSAEQALAELKNDQERQDASHQKTVSDLSDRLQRIAAGHDGRLRDPHGTGCGAGGGSTSDSAASAPSDRADHPAETGGLLSAELGGLLQQLTREADEVNVAYASCRADAYTIRSLP
jgi:hypothetical protein